MSDGFHRILVPLDGSGLAEAVVPFIIGLAARVDASLILLHVLERSAPQSVHGQPHLTSGPQAEAYLDGMVERCKEVGVRCYRHVHSPGVRSVATAIAEHAIELETDLIAMTTHGSGGLRDLLVGSIAQQTLSHGTTAVLLVRPQPAGKALPFECDTIVAAIDPGTHGLAPLHAAAGLARRLGAKLHLVTVVPDQATLPPERRSLARLAPHAAAAALDIEARHAVRELGEASASLAGSDGIETTAEVRRGDPLAQVASVVEDRSAGLLVVATHGRAGLESLLSGSFAAAITGHVDVPVLMVRIRRT